jgi:hypothetical protein
MPGTKSALFEQAQRAEQRGNREGRDFWERYATHRQRLTAEILALAPDGGRLCLLGAGNTNDVELEPLAERFDEVHLVDIDPASLARAQSRQGPEVRAKLRCHAPVDLSGVYLQLDAGRPPDREALVEAGVAAVCKKLPGDFDLVVSCCVLSQMSWALRRVAGDDAALFAELDQAMVNVHLRTLVALAAPGRPTLVAADLISTDHYPLDELPPDADLRAIVDELATARLAYAACNPELLRSLMRRDRTLAAMSEPPRIGQPWLWHAGQDRTYLVYPMVIARKA